MKTGVAAIAASLLLSACSKPADRQPSATPANVAAPAPQRASPVPPPGTGPDARTPLARPADAVDPKSSEAAVNLVQGFADLVNARKFDEAYMLLGPGAPPRAEFDRQWAQLRGLHVTVGKADAQEGAAGSIYVSVPLSVSGTFEGEPPMLSPVAILRRINDVPGSTQAQRRWHIERIEWGNAPRGR